ncbi:hypothetical protein ACLB2K_047646 [Fragaria x ananassa]
MNFFYPHVVVVGATAFTRRLKSQTNTSSCVAAHSNNIKWSLPPSDYVKLNFDGFVFQHNSNATSGFVLRDDSGCPLIVSTRKIGKTNVPIAEAVALRDGLLFARSLNISRVIIEGDSQFIINRIKGTTSIPWKLNSIVKDIIHIATGFEHISFSHMLREANFVADAVASHRHPQSWVFNFPRQLLLF